MIRIHGIRLRITREREAERTHTLKRKAAGLLRIKMPEIKSFTVSRHAIDARKKPELYDVFSVDIRLESDKKEKEVLRRCRKKEVVPVADTPYVFPVSFTAEGGAERRPVVIGFGPCGLFCAYELALHGLKPIVLERGADVDTRVKAVERFWADGVLDTETNVQFGEGGAGTFSDGKLNSGIKDKSGRIREMLRIFVRHGAPEEILYESMPHIGTDKLRGVVKSMREDIRRMGGEVYFNARADKFRIENGVLKGVSYHTPAGEKEIEADVAILAVGHSARDTFEVCAGLKIPMDTKPFAVGLRILHPQERIDIAQYGMKSFTDGDGKVLLPPAVYQCAMTSTSGRGVYSFCMCPGGYVVNASSEEGCLAVNGMSDYARDSGSANAAIVVQVSPEDFASYGDDALAGVRFQRDLEKKAFEVGHGAVPVQSYEMYKRNVKETENGDANEVSDRLTIPHIKGRTLHAPVHTILPPALNRCIIEGIETFGEKITGFNVPDALLAGVESRTSSPVKFLRDETYSSTGVKGLYPAGEGAGYAGGITSAAVDGMKVAEAVALHLSKGKTE